MDAIPVRVGDCTCPDTPHAEEGDVVLLSPTVPFRLGLAAERVLAQAGTLGNAGTEDALAEAYVRHGVVGWNLQYINGKGVPELRPLDIDHLLADWALSRAVAERGDQLYSETILRPFLQPTLPRPSPTGPTGDTTSPRSTRTRSRSKRSSASTMAGAQ